MEEFLKDFELEDKDRNIEALSRWRSAVSLVKNPRRRFRNVADLERHAQLKEKQVFNLIQQIIINSCFYFVCILSLIICYYFFQS